MLTVKRPESSILSPPRLGLDAAASTAESARWFDRAKQVLAGGISSSARATTTGSLPYPLYITHGQGSRLFDADGNQFIDYLLSYGSVVLGHADRALIDSVRNQLELGTMFGTCNTVEVELAEQICRMVPCAELVRFSNSGSEAMCGAVRAARGFTGRDKILKFEGHYHGWVDVLAVSNRPSSSEAGPADAPNSVAHSRGTPRGVVNDVIIAPWNDSAALDHLLDEHDGEIAAIVAEPIVANNACIGPGAGFLESLRSECDRRGIVLIFDEIVTGFRTAPGGAQSLFGVVPDIAVYSKAIGGGLPLSAFAGKRHIMQMIAANTVKHGGTYNGSPLCAAAALHTLCQLADADVRARLDIVGSALIEALRKASRDHRVPCAVLGQPSMFQIVFAPDGFTPKNYRDLDLADTKRYAALRQSLLEQGIHANSSGLACWFVSTAHTAEDVELTTFAIDRAFQSIAG
ncbi:MAG: glutamate-1-semialdehyde 2,1-aminomutase [Phycisphaerae bacterium]|nr:glutamate-1-semialdehyde 2,1-aminomutase [Phycisphaerae bacterium]